MKHPAWQPKPPNEALIAALLILTGIILVAFTR